MSQMAGTITVFDGAATPVSHTLTAVRSWVEPDGTQMALWREINAALPKEASITFLMSQKTLRSGVVETRSRVDVPVMESVAGQNAAGYTAAPKVAYHDSSESVSRAHPRSTPTGRRLCKQILINLLNNVSTSVTPISAGPIDEAASSLIMPT